MLATHCTFCQHDNQPGARFCAECGSPMHLKVCANPQCGKVSEASATVCETCGQPFPHIDLVAPGATATTTPTAPVPPPTEKPRAALWPLIAVAIAAGALPLLWANRAYIPAPKSGPFSNPEITKPSAPVPAPAPVAPTPAPVASPPPPAPSPAEETKDKTDKPVPPKKTEAPRPCTEALAALGLCPPKQAGK